MPFLSVEVDTDDFTRKDQLQRILARMGDILMAGGTGAARLVRNYYRNVLMNRHESSTRLGASSTSHYKASDVGTPVVDGSTVAVPITTPGITRAFNPIHIEPVEANALAIPLHADAYGFQPRELTDRGVELFRILKAGQRKGGEKSSILYRQDEGGLVAMYALVGSVDQPQDRTLLPSDAEMYEAFSTAAVKAVDRILK